jgi:hypothetical protein
MRLFFSSVIFKNPGRTLEKKLSFYKSFFLSFFLSPENNDRISNAVVF